MSGIGDYKREYKSKDKNNDVGIIMIKGEKYVRIGDKETKLDSWGVKCSVIITAVIILLMVTSGMYVIGENTILDITYAEYLMIWVLGGPLLSLINYGILDTMNYKVESSKDREFEDEKEQVKGYGETRVKDKMNLNNYKKVYLMPNKTLKFGYELVRLEDSTSDKLVINYGKGEDEWHIFNYESKSMQNAVRMYKKNEVLPDETIMKLLYTYLILIEDRENTETYEHYQDLLDNRDKLENKSYFKSLGKKEQELKEELSMLGQMQDRHIEENKLIINRVKKEYNII